MNPPENRDQSYACTCILGAHLPYCGNKSLGGFEETVIMRLGRAIHMTRLLDLPSSVVQCYPREIFNMPVLTGCRRDVIGWVALGAETLENERGTGQTPTLEKSQLSPPAWSYRYQHNSPSSSSSTNSRSPCPRLTCHERGLADKARRGGRE